MTHPNTALPSALVKTLGRALVSASLTLALTACSSKKAAEPEALPAPRASSEPTIAADEARTLVASGAPIIDVRSQEEWDDGHLDQAKLIPVQEFTARIGEVDALVGGDKSKPVVVVCRSGGRASKAKAALEAAGYTHVVNGGRWENLK